MPLPIVLREELPHLLILPYLHTLRSSYEEVTMVPCPLTQTLYAYCQAALTAQRPLMVTWACDPVTCAGEAPGHLHQAPARAIRIRHATLEGYVGQHSGFHWVPIQSAWVR